MESIDTAFRGDIRMNAGVRHVQNVPLTSRGGQRPVLSTWNVHGRCHAARKPTAAETRMGVHDERSKRPDDGIHTANWVGLKLRKDNKRLMPK